MIEINNLTAISLDKKFVKGIGNEIFRGEKIKKETALSVAFVSSQRIKELNKKYRGKDKVVSILSFPDTEREFRFRSGKTTGILGEIIICPSELKKNAPKYKIGFQAELARVFIHGILHLLGYEDKKGEKAAKKMEEKEEYYISKIIKTYGQSLFYRRA